MSSPIHRIQESKGTVPPALSHFLASLRLKLLHAYVCYAARRFAASRKQPLSLLSDCQARSRRFMDVEEDAASQVRRLEEGGHSVVLLLCDPESAARAQGVFQDPRPNSTVILTQPAAERFAGVPEPWKRVPMVPQVEAYTTAGRV